MVLNQIKKNSSQKKLFDWLKFIQTLQQRFGKHVQLKSQKVSFDLELVRLYGLIFKPLLGPNECTSCSEKST